MKLRRFLKKKRAKGAGFSFETLSFQESFETYINSAEVAFSYFLMERALKRQILDILVEISEKMNGSSEFETLLGDIIAVTKDYLDVKRVSLMLIDGDLLEIRAYAGFEPEKRSVPLHSGLAGEVARTGKAILVNKGQNGAEEYSSSTSYFLLPLKAREKVLGVLNLTNKRDDFFSSADEAIGKYIASQCALAVERYNLYAEKRMSENLRIIGMLKTSVAHDISNLLGIAEVYIGLMEEEAESGSSMAEYIEAVKSEIKRVSVLATDMLDFSKQKLNLHKTSFSVNEFVKELEKHSKALTKDAGIEITYRADEGLYMTADRNRLFRVFFNIIGNAAEAVGEKGRIAFRARRVKGDVVFMIMDNGKGIKKENMKMLFDPFFTSGKTKGTGLGLAVVKDIVEAHGGSVSVRSLEKAYTCFLIRIPANG